MRVNCSPAGRKVGLPEFYFFGGGGRGGEGYPVKFENSSVIFVQFFFKKLKSEHLGCPDKTNKRCMSKLLNTGHVLSMQFVKSSAREGVHN